MSATNGLKLCPSNTKLAATSARQRSISADCHERMKIEHSPSPSALKDDLDLGRREIDQRRQAQPRRGAHILSANDREAALAGRRTDIDTGFAAPRRHREGVLRELENLGAFEIRHVSSRTAGSNGSDAKKSKSTDCRCPSLQRDRRAAIEHELARRAAEFVPQLALRRSAGCRGAARSAGLSACAPSRPGLASSVSSSAPPHNPQCATAAAPCSATRAPEAKRVSEKGAAMALGSSRATGRRRRGRSPASPSSRRCPSRR